MSLIDADTHVIETDKTWDFLEGSDRQYRPVQAETYPTTETAPGQMISGQPKRFWVVEGNMLVRGGADSSSKNPVPVGAKELSDIPLRLKQMDEYDVDVQVMFPTFFLQPFTRRAAVEVALCRAYNRWLADAWSKAKRRLRWVVVPPYMDIEQSIKELEFGKANGACGIFIRGYEAERALDDPYFFPFYQKAMELDLPICIHAGIGSHLMMEAYKAAANSSFGLALNAPVYQAFGILMMSDVPKRFPSLRWAFIETSSQWVPFYLHEAARRLSKRGQTLVKDPLRHYNFWVSMRPDDDLAYVLSYSGDDHIIAGTDYGHTDLAAQIDALQIVKTAPGVSPEAANKILDDNARALYAIEA